MIPSAEAGRPFCWKSVGPAVLTISPFAYCGVSLPGGRASTDWEFTFTALFVVVVCVLPPVVGSLDVCAWSEPNETKNNSASERKNFVCVFMQHPFEMRLMGVFLFLQIAVYFFSLAKYVFTSGPRFGSFSVSLAAGIFLGWTSLSETSFDSKVAVGEVSGMVTRTRYTSSPM